MASVNVTLLDSPGQGETKTGMTVQLPVPNAPGTVQTGRIYIRPDGSLVVRADT